MGNPSNLVTTFSQFTTSLLLTVFLVGGNQNVFANDSKFNSLLEDPIENPLVWYLEFYFTEKHSSNIFSLVKNSEIENFDDWSFEVLSEPNEGELIFLEEGKFEYIATDEFKSQVKIKFLVCNLQEEDLCYECNVRLIMNPDLKFKNFDFVIPKGLSPNNDGKNDLFKIPALEEQPDVFSKTNLSIFNREGEVIYVAKDYKNNWDGTFMNSSQPVPDGIYFYTLQVPNPSLRKAGVLIVKR